MRDIIGPRPNGMVYIRYHKVRPRFQISEGHTVQIRLGKVNRLG